MKYLETYNLTELKESELKETNGGLLQAILGVAAAVSLIGALAYGAGYLYGKITCDK